MKDESVDIIEIERLGGLAGFGGSLGRLRSVGRLDLAQLGQAHREAVEALLDGSLCAAGNVPRYPDGFRHRLSRMSSSSTPMQASIEVSESVLPDFVRDAVHDELN